ncbi:MAG: amidophosphoribosyltransferase [Candidatus Nealsonbacteria bacterium]
MCGILGMVSNKDVAPEIVLGIYDLQHRGEQGAGIAVSDGEQMKEHRGSGLVTEIFNERDREAILQRCLGNFGIGHTLYSTIGKTGEEKQPKTYQPLMGKFHDSTFAIAHNGNLINYEPLKKEAKEKGYVFQSEASDTEVIASLISTSEEKDFLVALKKILPRLNGAFALVILYKNKVIGIRDKYGIRPLCLGQGNSSFIFASESCAFFTVGANFLREVEPGEIVVLGNGIEESSFWASDSSLKLCMFEYVYFARPDSTIAGRSVYSYRTQSGKILAQESPVEADMIMPVPESGRIYNYAYAWELAIRTEEGLFKNRYFSIKTFLTSRETDRKFLQRIKLHPLREVVHGKRVCVTEDSLIRANVLPEVVAMLREKGASEVHARIFSSPIRYPCFLGIDLASQIELVAASLSEEEIGRKVIQADSLHYISLEGMIKASGLTREQLCLGCFTGKYPVDLPKNWNLKPPS